MHVKSIAPRSLEHRVAELEEALAREARTSSALREVGLALGTTLDLDQLLELILQKITDVLEADRAIPYLLDEAKDELVSRVVDGDGVKSIRLQSGTGVAGYVARTGKPLHVKDAYQDARFQAEWGMLGGYRTRSVLAAPMKNHLGRTIGVIQVLNKRGGEFTEIDAVILAALATQAAVSIDNSRLFLSVNQKNMQLLDIKEQLEHRIRDLKLLFDLERAMGRAASLDDLFMAVLGEAMRSCESRAAGIALRDDEGRVALHLVDDKHPKIRPIPLRGGDGFIGDAMRTNKDIVSNNARADARDDPELAKRAGFEFDSVAVVPLEGEDGGPMGALALYNKRDKRGFSDEDRNLLLLLAANASTALRLQLSREAREREERLTTIGRLLSGVMHDLKTPLAVISGHAQLMQNIDSKEERNRHADAILKQCSHIGAMQREVLEFARGDKIVLVRKVYLVKFFGEVQAQLEKELARSGIELVIDLQDKGTARFDEGKILRVVHNLARNAAEAMAERGGRFTIMVKRAKDTNALLLTFSDTGPGIPKEIEHRLFQSFVTSGKRGGTGLGLAIVKKIAEEHGGSVSVHSTSKGATFKLTLPQPDERT